MHIIMYFKDNEDIPKDASGIPEVSDGVRAAAAKGPVRAEL